MNKLDPGSIASAYLPLGLQRSHHTHMAFMWVLEIQIPVFILAQKVIHILTIYQAPTNIFGDTVSCWPVTHQLDQKN